MPASAGGADPAAAMLCAYPSDETVAAAAAEALCAALAAAVAKLPASAASARLRDDTIVRCGKVGAVHLGFALSPRTGKDD